MPGSNTGSTTAGLRMELLQTARGSLDRTTSTTFQEDSQNAWNAFDGGAYRAGGHGMIPGEFNAGEAFVDDDEEDGRGLAVRTVLTTPDQFFESAHQLGFRICVAAFRDNQLARHISSFELKNRRYGKGSFFMHAKEDFIDLQLVSHFEKLTHYFNRAVSAAQSQNFNILSFTFDDVTHDLCEVSNYIIRIAGCSKELQACKKKVGHMSTSHRQLSMAERIGKESAGSVSQQLKGTSYEWMLNLTASTWPSNVPRPVPVLLPGRVHVHDLHSSEA